MDSAFFHFIQINHLAFLQNGVHLIQEILQADENNACAPFAFCR